jgi:hypothetical protein
MRLLSIQMSRNLQFISDPDQRLQLEQFKTRFLNIYFLVNFQHGWISVFYVHILYVALFYSWTVQCPNLSKTSLKRSFSVFENDRFGLVFAKTVSTSSALDCRQLLHKWQKKLAWLFGKGGSVYIREVVGAAKCLHIQYKTWQVSFYSVTAVS